MPTPPTGMCRYRGHFEQLPWPPKANAQQASRALADAPLRALSAGRRKIQLEDVLDGFLRMTWDLSLAAPLIVEKHPFDTNSSDGFEVFSVNGHAGEEATPIKIPVGESLRDAVDFNPPSNVDGFEVHVDELVLRRPIKLSLPQATSSALQQPLMFVGHYRTEYPKRAVEFSGGPLEFSAYFFWTPRLLPPDHSGVLIRVNEASGTLSDSSFLGFPVSEERRMSQITCEIFVREGFDGALNIDRESYNHSHPHVITVTRWLHGALRQVIATQKRRGSSANRQRRQRSADSISEKIEAVVEQVWDELDLDDEPPTVEFGDSQVDRLPGDRRFTWPEQTIEQAPAGPNWEQRQNQRIEIATALTRILDAYGVWNTLDPARQASLMKAIADVVQVHLK